MEKKSTKTITFHRADNYGAVLQTYALQKCVSKEYKNEVLDYYNNSLYDMYKIFYNPEKNIIKRMIRFAKNAINFRKNIIRHNNFNRFRRKINISNSTPEEWKKNPADVYITGSDQVWNPKLTGGLDKMFFLQEDYMKQANRISYAASCGNTQNIENVELLKKYLKEFDSISTREKTFNEYLLKNGIKNQEVLDPVFLLEKEEWVNEIIESKPVEKGDYIFVYWVGNPDKHFYDIVNNFAKNKNMKVVFFERRDKNHKLICDKKSYFEAGPKEFLNLLYYSKFVITTSFHATAFSVIFNKDFYYVPLANSERVTSLLDKINLHKRLIDNNINYNLDKIDWNKVENILEKEREASIGWLYKAIG